MLEANTFVLPHVRSEERLGARLVTIAVTTLKDSLAIAAFTNWPSAYCVNTEELTKHWTNQSQKVIGFLLELDQINSFERPEKHQIESIIRLGDFLKNELKFQAELQQMLRAEISEDDAGDGEDHDIYQEISEMLEYLHRAQAELIQRLAEVTSIRKKLTQRLNKAAAAEEVIAA